MHECKKKGAWLCGTWLAISESFTKSLVAKGGIDAVIDAMRHHLPAAKVQENGCFALQYLCDGDDENRKAIGVAGGIEVVIAAMKQHPSNDRVQEYGCVVVGYSHTIASPVAEMKEYLSDARVQEKGCAALQKLASENAENRKAIAAAGGIEAVLAAMKQHPSALDVQKWGCAALANLARNNVENRKAIAAVGGIEAVVAAMKQHPSAANVQQQGCSALGWLASNDENQKAIVTAGGIEAVLAAMKQHPSAVNVQGNGCAALWTIADGNAENTKAIATVGGIDAVVTAMKQHPSIADVQVDGCGALHGLASKNAENKKAISAVGGIEAVVAAMKQHPSAANVQQYGALVLKKLKDISPKPPSKPIWDQRGVPDATWKALLAGKPSGTFVIRSSKGGGTAGNVIASISIVKPGGSADGVFHQHRIVTLPSGKCKLVNSEHAHASLDALVAFYQDPMYFAQAGKRDLPVQLKLLPSASSGSGGAAAARPAAAGGGGDDGSSAYETLFWRDGKASTPSSTTTESPYADLDISTPAQQHIYNSVVDDHDESVYQTLSPYNPLDRLGKTPILPFLDAAAAARKECNGSIVADSKTALAYASKHRHLRTVQRKGVAALTADDIAALYLYTMETAANFYGRLNEELGGYGRAAENTSEFDAAHFLPITKLLVRAFEKLPPLCTKLFRGVTLPYTVILKNVDGGDAVVGDEVLWKQVTSCSTSPNVLKCKNFLGERTAGTVFQIWAVTGVNVQAYSESPGEDEVVLPPGSRFVVEAITPWKYGVTEVRLRQILADRGGGGSASEPIYEEVSQYMALTPA